MGAVREVYNRLLKVTRCKNCGRKLSRKVTTCESGHTVCDTCFDTLEVCMECEGDFFDRYHIFYTKVMSALRDKTNFLDKLYDILECPVCYENLTCPSWTCWNGHITCGRCYFYTSTCPLCREEFTNLYNTDINAMLSVLEAPIECINKTFGCEYSDKYLRLKAHEVVCEFKQYDCLIDNCSYTGILSRMSQHVENSHPKQVFQVDSTRSLDFEVCRETRTIMISSNPTSYWLKSKLDSDEIKLSLIFMGLKPEIKNASLTLKNRTYAVPISPITDLNSTDYICTLTLDPDSWYIGKNLWCNLTLNSKRSSWLVNTMFLAALAANLTFAIIILEKNMH